MSPGYPWIDAGGWNDSQPQQPPDPEPARRAVIAVCCPFCKSLGVRIRSAGDGNLTRLECLGCMHSWRESGTVYVKGLVVESG